MITEIHINDSKKWDNTVQQFDNYDVYYLSGYVKAFQELGAGTPVLIYYENGSTKAMNVIMERDIALSPKFEEKLPIDTWFDISTPYGYGGFWIEGDDFSGLEKEYTDYCNKKGYISEFVRFHLFSNYKDIFDGVVESRTHNIVRSLGMNLEDMFMDFKHGVRKNVKRANKSGLKIVVDKEGKYLDDFLNIYNGTMDRNEASANFYFPKTFFENINKISNHFVYFHVVDKEKIIATELVLYGKDYSYSFLGGTNSEYFHLRPNDFLKYEIIKWSKENGLKYFVLGGGYGEDDGIFNYKRNFSPNGVKKFYIGKRVFNQQKYNQLVEMRLEDSKLNSDTDYFPIYRS